MIIVADNIPSDSTTINAVQNAVNAGIKVIIVGIGSNGYSNLNSYSNFGNTVSVNDYSELNNHLSQVANYACLSGSTSSTGPSSKSCK